MSSVREAALQLAGALEFLNIRYAIGGSFASSVHGIARPTQDLDFIAAILPGKVDAFVALVQQEFYVDSDAILQALHHRRSFNVIHFASGFKLDIFPVSSHDLGPQQLGRCRVEETAILGGAAVSLPVISAEDTILVKLRWYRDGGESSERQWNDMRNIVKVQGNRLDLEYLREWSRELRVEDLLNGLLNEGGA